MNVNLISETKLGIIKSSYVLLILLILFLGSPLRDPAIKVLLNENDTNCMFFTKFSVHIIRDQKTYPELLPLMDLLM